PFSGLRRYARERLVRGSGLAMNTKVSMRKFLVPLLLAAVSAPALADPVPRVNIGLLHDELEVAATTTLEDGGAVLQAPEDGEYGLIQQSTLPVESRLTA